MLIPGWIASELYVRFEHFRGNETAVMEFIFLTALMYLGIRSSDKHFTRAMHLIGGIALLPAFCAVAVTAHETFFFRQELTPTALVRFITAFVAFGIPLLAAWLTRGRRAAFEFGFSLWLIVAARLAAQNYSDVLSHVALYAWCALAAVVMVLWGVRDQRAAFINMGVLAFALDIMVFYFSDVMDKLGRSASLIAFGMIFLLGGWWLEKLRRGLIVRTAGGTL